MIKKILFVAAALALYASYVGAAFAQAPTCVQGAAGVPPAVTLSFTPPTLNTDNTPIATPLTYNLYQSTVSGKETKVKTGLSGSPISVTVGLQTGVTEYFQISVVDANGTESSLSDEVCKTFPISKPDTVTIMIVMVRVLLLPIA